MNHAFAGAAREPPLQYYALRYLLLVDCVATGRTVNKYLEIVLNYKDTAMNWV